MKVLCAGAFGNLGIEILRQLIKTNVEIIAADLKEKDDPELKGKYQFIPIDVTKPETLKDICQGVDVVITTIGLTGASTKYTCYDIDYQGNLALLKEAQKANVKNLIIFLLFNVIIRMLEKSLCFMQNIYLNKNY